jgi:hypothetical protein
MNSGYQPPQLNPSPGSSFVSNTGSESMMVCPPALPVETEPSRRTQSAGGRGRARDLPLPAAPVGA